MQKEHKKNDKVHYILWLEDEPERIAYELALTIELFEQAELEVEIITIGTISEALHQLKARRFSFILVDQQIRLPGAAARNEELKWAGLGVFAWIRTAGKLEGAAILNSVPDIIVNELEPFESVGGDFESNVKWNAMQDIIIVTGISMPETSDFIKTVDALVGAQSGTKQGKTRVLYKPIDEEQLAQYIEGILGNNFC